MPDFFVSYTSADRAWAEWIAYVLEEEGFSIIIQAWDFRPGSDFVLEMHKAATGAAHHYGVLARLPQIPVHITGMGSCF